MNCIELDSYARLDLPVVGAEGAELILADGRRVLDLYGGHCVNTLGAGDPGLGAALARQWSELSFVTNMLAHQPREAFLDAIGPLMPPGQWHLFATNSGAEANESALKGALFAGGRQRIVAFEGAFHGRTAAAHAASDAKQRVFGAAPFEVVRVPFNAADAARAAIDDSIGAVIIEPVQSLAGVATATPEFLQALRESCDRSGAVLIFDEVQTATGRTGEPFAAQYFGVTPDVITTAKGAGGGVPIGLTWFEDAVGAKLERFLMGSTFGGGPLAFAAAAEIARRIGAPGFLESVRETSAELRQAALRGPITELRGAGLLVGMVLEEGYRAVDVRNALLEHDVLVGTSMDPRVLRLMPPLVLPSDAALRLERALLSVRPAQVTT